MLGEGNKGSPYSARGVLTPLGSAKQLHPTLLRKGTLRTGILANPEPVITSLALHPFSWLLIHRPIPQIRPRHL